MTEEQEFKADFEELLNKLGFESNFAKVPASEMAVWKYTGKTEVTEKYNDWNSRLKAKEEKLSNKDSSTYTKIRDIISLILDVLGFFSGVGTIADILNAGVSLLPDVNILNAFISVIAAALPFVGNAIATSFKSIVKAIDKGDNIADFVKQIGKLFNLADDTVIVTKIKSISSTVITFMKNIGKNIEDFITETWFYKWLGKPVIEAIEKVTKFFDSYVDDIAKSIDDEVNDFCGKIENGVKKCFVAGTKILTKTGFKNIEDIKAGDMVKSYNENTKEAAYKKVVRTFEKKAKDLYNIEVDGEVITSTSEHPYYVVDKGFVEAKDLQVGDRLLTSENIEKTVERVVAKTQTSATSVFNFEVEDFHTYYVGEQSLLVHNTCSADDIAKGTSETGLADDVIEVWVVK